MKNCVINNGKFLRSKCGRSIGSAGSGSEDRTQGRRGFPKSRETTQQPDGSEDPLDAGATHATHTRNTDSSRSKDHWQQDTQD